MDGGRGIFKIDIIVRLSVSLVVRSASIVSMLCTGQAGIP